MTDREWAKANDRNVQDLFRFRLVASIALSRKSSFLDIGANRGEYIKVASQYCLEKRIHAFEPIPYLATYLKGTYPKANIYQVAVSDSNEFAQFNVANLDELSGLSMRNQQELPSGTTFTSIETKVVSIDAYLKTIKNLDLVKIDIEGAEINALIGMKALLIKYRPFIFVEHGVHGSEHFGFGPKDFWETVVNMNYRILTVDGQEIGSLEVLIDSYFNWPIWNYLLVPNER
jgi:FkbM family methyltransferase